MSYIKSKSFKIVSRFYVIYGDYNPVYVGYTNRTVKQRFKEHQKDKDFSKYDNVEVKELIDEKLSFDFTWDYEQTCKNADQVSLREYQLVQKYGTQDSIFQKADGGGQTWASEKWFVKSNRDNHRFTRLSGAEIKKKLKEEKVIGIWLSNFVGNMKPVEEVWLHNFITDIRPMEKSWLGSFVSRMTLIEQHWLNNFVGGMRPIEEIWLGSFIGTMNPVEEVWLGSFVNRMKPAEEVWLNNFVNNMRPIEDVWLSHFVSGMKPIEQRWLNSFVGSIKLLEERWLSDFVGDMKNKNKKVLTNPTDSPII